MAEMISKLLLGQVLTPQGLISEGVIAFSGENIAYVGEYKTLPAQYHHWKIDDKQNGLFIPGFVDVHVHGGAGYDFMNSDKAALDAITKYHSTQGTTTMLATTMTAPKKAIDSVLAQVSNYMNQEMSYAQIAGVHLEGPFISPKWCGAQNPQHIVPPSVSWLKEWEAQYPKLIRQVTLAPERVGAKEAIQWLRQHHITAALGHTDATYDEVIAAVDLGLNQAVHTFNAMTPLHHRQPGVVGAILTDKRISAEIIADGIHVHPAMVSLLISIKNEANLLLITDAMSATGLSDGAYMLGDLPVTVLKGKATLTDNPNALAGSTLTMIQGFRFLVKQANLSIEEASSAASLTPARSLGLDHLIGSLEAGKRADILMLDDELNLVNVWVKGKDLNKLNL
jgi:N-acetylglucosamine-6-phosphate deacetylase